MVLMRMKDASEYTGLNSWTIRKYIDNNVIHGSRIGKHRFVDTNELDKLMGKVTNVPEGIAIYARVSTHKQVDNLERQKNRLINYCNQNNIIIVDVIHEIASGVNEQRKGLQKIIKLAKERKINAVVVEYKDRLARLGFEYIKQILNEYGVKIIILDTDEKTPEEELVNDLIAIVTSFSARIYGKRGVKRIINKIKEETKCMKPL